MNNLILKASVDSRGLRFTITQEDATPWDGSLEKELDRELYPLVWWSKTYNKNVVELEYGEARKQPCPSR